MIETVVPMWRVAFALVLGWASGGYLGYFVGMWIERKRHRRARLLAQRLRSWAQNEEMIDHRFTDHGRDCLWASKLLEVSEDEE